MSGAGGQLEIARQLLEEQPGAIGAALEAGLAAFLDVLTGRRPARAAGQAEGLDSRGIVEAMPPPKQDRERYRVTVNKPRKGRDRDQWRLHVMGPGVDTHRLSGVEWAPSTRAIAEQRARALEAELNGEAPEIVAQEQGVTWGEVMQGYVDWCFAHRSEGSAKVNRQALAWLERTGLADKTQETIARRDLVEARDKLFLALKGNTAASYWRRWFQGWRWGAERELVEEHALPTVRLRKLTPADKTQKRALTHDEVLDKLEFARTYANGRYLTFLWAMAETSARIGQLGKLDAGDFAFEGPGRPGRLRAAWRTVKHQEDHYSWVSPGLAQALHDELGGRSDGPLWRAARGGRMTRESLDRLNERWAESRGLIGEVDNHSFRRYCVGRLEDRGVPQSTGMKVTGHRSPITYQQYAEKAQARVRQAAAVLWLGLSMDTAGVSLGAANLTRQNQPSSGFT